MKPLILAALAGIVTPLQLTIAEFQDKYDESTTTAFQPDLVIGAWGTWIILCVMIFVGAPALQKQKEVLKELDEIKKLTQP